MPDHVHMMLRIPPKYVVPQSRDEQIGSHGHGLQ